MKGEDGKEWHGVVSRWVGGWSCDLDAARLFRFQGDAAVSIQSRFNIPATFLFPAAAGAHCLLIIYLKIWRASSHRLTI